MPLKSLRIVLSILLILCLFDMPYGYYQIVRVIGIDPGYHRCGYCVLDFGAGREELISSGCLVTNAKQTMAERLHSIATGLDGLLIQWHPQVLAVEDIFFAKNVKTAIGVAQARGVIIERAASMEISVAEYSPTTVKSQLTGSGKADKKQVEFMVRRWISFPDDVKRLDDELDAIAVAICRAQRANIPG